MNMIGKKSLKLNNEGNCEKQCLQLNDEGDLHNERKAWNWDKGNLYKKKEGLQLMTKVACT